MELNVARDECRKMLKRLNAFKAVDEILEAAENALAGRAKVEKDVKELEQIKIAVLADIRELDIILEAKEVEKHKLEDDNRSLIAVLERAYKEREKELQAVYDQAEVEASKRLSELKKSIGAAMKRLADLEEKIKQAYARLEDAMRKYEDFKKGL